MRRRDFIVLLGSAAIAPISAHAEPAVAATTIAARLVGAWQFMSSVSVRDDGSGVDRWGTNPKGMFIFDGNGHFTQAIVGEESRLFGGKSYFAFGTYSVDEANKVIVTNIEGSSLGKLSGTVQKRVIKMLSATELIYVNLANSTGGKVEAQWRRLKD